MEFRNRIDSVYSTHKVLIRPLKNVFEAADTRQKQARKRSLCVINEHFEPVFNTVAATQIVFQRPVIDPY